MSSSLRRVLPIFPLLLALGCDSGNGGSSAPPPPAAGGPPPSVTAEGGKTKELKASGPGSSANKDTTIIGTK